MSDKDLQVNKEDFDVISIDEKDASFQYTIVPNALIRDKTISPNCRWLIIYLISNKAGWTIKSRQLWEHTKGFIGRDGIRKTLNEAIEAGYILRKMLSRDTPTGKIRGYSYTVASTPKFKKCLPEPDFQGPENQGTKELLSLRNITPPIPPQNLEEELQIANAIAAEAAEEILRNSPKPKKAKPALEFSSDIKHTVNLMVLALKQANPDWLIPNNLFPLYAQLDLMVASEKRDPTRIVNVFMWTISDNFWMDKISKTNPLKYLREHFAQLAAKMDAKPVIQNKVDRRTKNMDGTPVDAPHLKDLF